MGAAVFAFGYWRLWYGVDFTDEAYYTAVPLRFVRGAHPFIDETTPLQPAGLLIYPAIAAYHAVAGVDGIVLFARHLYFAFSWLVAACVYAGLRPFVRTRAEAIVPALLPVAFVPFSLPSPSYDTLGSGSMIAGLFLGLRFLATGRWAWLSAAGLMSGVAIVAYPPLFAPAVVLLAQLVWRRRSEWTRVALGFGMAALVPIALVTAVALDAGLHNVRDAYLHASEFGEEGGGITKVVSVGSEVARLLLAPPLWILGVMAIAVGARLRPIAGWATAALLPLFVLLGHDVSNASSARIFAVILGFCALPLARLARDDRSARAPFSFVWPAAFVAGLSTAWASNTGGGAFSVGFAAAPIVTTVLVGLCYSDKGEHAAFVTGAAVLSIFLALQFTYVYRDGPFSTLDAQIDSGPYAGLHTTPSRRRFVETLASDLRRLSPSRCGILFYDSFPGGYLMSSSRPDTNAVFLLPVPKPKLIAYRELLFTYYKEGRTLPDVVVAMSSVPGLEGYGLPTNDPLGRLTSKSGIYTIAKRRPDYEIYQRKHAPCLRSS